MTLTLWYQLGSAKGTWSPKGSNGSASSSSFFVGITAFVVSFLGSGAACVGDGVASTLGLLSSEPTCSFALYLFRIPSLWYFQNCLDASFPATRVRIFLPPGEPRCVSSQNAEFAPHGCHS